MALPNIDIDQISKTWHRRTGFFAVLVPLLVIELSLLPTAAGAPLWVWSLTMVITVGLVELAWQLSRALPKTRKDKVGFVISLSSDDEQEAKRIRADFVQTLQRLIKAGKAGATFQFIEIPNFRADDVVDLDDAQRLRIATRAHFVLYGRVRVRKLNGKDHHLVELDGIVAHQPIPQQISDQLAQEFSELLPRKVAIPTDNDLFAFQFASEWAELVAKYIIAIAAALSGDDVYAEQLYSESLERVNGSKSDFPIFVKLRQRIPTRIWELYEARATVHYERWANSHDQYEIERMGPLLEKIDHEKFNRTSTFYLNAIYAFLHDNNVAGALGWLNRCGAQYRDAVWQLNVAFLVAYGGDLKTATRHYRKAIAQEMNPDLISKIEDFVLYVATANPDKYQLFFCLGFFNWQVKGDTVQAAKDFGAFLASRLPGQYEAESKLATKWLAQFPQS